MRTFGILIILVLLPSLSSAQTINSRTLAGDGTPITDTNSGRLDVTTNAEGSTGDAAVTTNATGTMSGKLRGLVAILADVWDSVGHTLKVTIQNATMAVTQSGTWNITNISGTVSLPTGAATAANQDGIIRDGTGDTTQANVTSGRLNVDPGTVTVIQGTGTNLHIVCDSGCSSSAGFADNSAFTFGTTAVNPIAGVLDDTATNVATENSAAVARITAQKGLHVNLRNNSGTELGTSGAPVRTDPTGTTTQPVSATSLPLPTGAATLTEQQTQTTALQLIDNLPLAQGATTSGQSGVLAQGAVTTAAPTYTTGNTNPISLQTDGSQRVAVTNTPSVNVSQINGVAPSMGNGVSGTGVQRVTLASDSTGQVAVASLPNEGQQTMANSISVAIASDQSSLPVTEQSSSAILAGQQAVTGTAAALATNTVKEVCVKALLANTGNVYVGPSGVTTSTGLELGPGDSYCTRVTNTNALFVIAAGAGPSVSWAARN